MSRGALLVVLALGAAGGLAWWRGRPGAELVAELEDVSGMSPRAGELVAIAGEPNVQAFLGMIRYAEGTAGLDGYRKLFGGELFAHFADHPRLPVTRNLGGRPLTSTAAGAYQILERTWNDVVGALHLTDFSPGAQDVAAVWLIRRRGALDDVREGRFDDAVAKCAKEWASLPGSPYGQPVKTLAQVRNVYASAGGSFA